MDGVHDLGGLVGFGSVEHEPMEPVFHEPWEGRVFGMMGAVSLAGYTSGPSFRHAIERMDGVHYLASSYYEHWLTGLATLLVERGVISASDLLDRVDDFPLARPIADDPLPPAFAGLVDNLMATWGSGVLRTPPPQAIICRGASRAQNQIVHFVKRFG